MPVRPHAAVRYLHVGLAYTTLPDVVEWENMKTMTMKIIKQPRMQKGEFK